MIIEATMNTARHQTIHELLEKALRQITDARTQITTFEGHLHEIKSQIDQSLEAIDSVLKETETGEHEVEKVRNDVAVTLGEMFEQMTRIVDGARDQMLHQHDVAPITQPVQVEQDQTKQEQTQFESESSEPESSLPEVLNGNEAGQRAAESLDEMVSTIKEETSLSQQVQAMETPQIAEPQTHPQEEPAVETPKEKELGNSDALSTLLAKARAASGETPEGPTELTSLAEEEEDTQAVNELLQNTSGSFIAQ